MLFNAPMVRAILAGQKTQTRRAMKMPHGLWETSALGLVPIPVGCPFGKPGDRLWVRESFRIGEDLGEDWEDGMDVGNRFPIYQADGEHGRYGVVPLEWEPPRNAREVHNSEGTAEHWRSFGPIPSIHMPRWACRLVLEITDVRVERLQAISEADADAEGFAGGYPWELAPDIFTAPHDRWGSLTIPECFGVLWSSINGKASWDANPWVWVIEFKRVTA
ncbi:hypothetical protein HEP73_02115 [Xanthomonas sp. GW]|nr:hypothetical protein HEP73_02115 [Xanthomonas sp. GW]